jgi:hypothetical protein
MKAKASITIAALLISTGVWAQSPPQTDPKAYGTGSTATDKGPPDAKQDADKAKSSQKMKQKHSAGDMHHDMDASGTSGTRGTTGSGSTTGTELRNDLRNDLTPPPPTSKQDQGMMPMPRKTEPTPTPTPDFPPSKQY